MLTITLPFPSSELMPNRRLGKHWGMTEDEFLRLNWRTKEHAELAADLGRTRNSVRTRCFRLGLVDTDDNWTEEQLSTLRSRYAVAASAQHLRLAELARAIGKDKANVCRKARELGLTDQSRKKVEAPKVRARKFHTEAERSADRSARAKAYIATNGHPRGALGMRHTPETKARIAKASADRWAAMTPEEQEAHVMKSAATRRAKGVGAPKVARGTWKSGWREVGAQRCYFRSRWEANYARYLEWLRSIGEIAAWEHEPHTFWFKGIKRGCVSYLPDFRVTNKSGSVEWHEVKGWMDDRSRTALKRMAKYHPAERVVLIQEKQYREIKNKVSSLIAGWEE